MSRTSSAEDLEKNRNVRRDEVRSVDTISLRFLVKRNIQIEINVRAAWIRFTRYAIVLKWV